MKWKGKVRIYKLLKDNEISLRELSGPLTFTIQSLLDRVKIEND